MAAALGGEEQGTLCVVGPGLVDAESHGPGPKGTAVPVGMTWGQQRAPWQQKDPWEAQTCPCSRDVTRGRLLSAQEQDLPLWLKS